MILVDTSIWVDHLHKGDPVMVRLLDEDSVMMHPFVYGEIALGSLRDRRSTLDELMTIPRAEIAHNDEVMAFINAKKLHGSGIGFVDAHLLASVLLSPEGLLWTRDRRLQAAAEALGVDATAA
jgi:predicted nucleic acid-binding protein